MVGYDIFRINLSHTHKKDIINKINLLKRNKIKNICIDTEGAQVRTTSVRKKIFLKKNKIIKIYNNNEFSGLNSISLYPNFSLKKCKIN